MCWTSDRGLGDPHHATRLRRCAQLDSVDGRQEVVWDKLTGAEGTPRKGTLSPKGPSMDGRGGDKPRGPSRRVSGAVGRKCWRERRRHLSSVRRSRGAGGLGSSEEPIRMGTGAEPGIASSGENGTWNCFVALSKQGEGVEESLWGGEMPWADLRREGP